MEDDYLQRLGVDISFESKSFYHKKLIICFASGCVVSVLGATLAFINSTHFFGFTASLVSFVLGLVGAFYLSRIPKNEKERKCLCLPTMKKSKMYMRLFFFILYIVFVTFVLIFILLKLIAIFKDPSKMDAEKCVNSQGCARISVFGEDHRAASVNPDLRFTIKHIGVDNTRDLILACADKQVQLRVEHSPGNNDSEDDPIEFHLNFASIFFGFVDDMFIRIIQCTETYGGQQEISLGLEIQSQSRIGNFDFGVNPSRISHFLQCIESQILNIHSKVSGVSVPLKNMHIANRGNACLANKQTEEAEEGDEHPSILPTFPPSPLQS
ncbi:unnamed protein product [Moneuplotes crassus]|uniref:Uncharacterized protein n=1 Tax=Euplotes crassus TaxID=5936 RepID=A0AAD2CZN4_EUPCR|nr:unnamed protein product [Moneuplotes crassus]